MYRGYIGCLLLSAILSGCSGWETKKVSSEELFTEAWNAIDITEVDTYPSFEKCSTFTEREAQRQCFETTVVNSLKEHLGQYAMNFDSSFTDTLKVHFMINEKGAFCIDSLIISSRLQQNVPRIALWIDKGLEDIPQAFPATKRGIPVKAQFEVPIVFEVQ